MTLLSGLDRLITEESGRIRGRKLGVLCHHASITRDATFIVDAIQQAGGQIVRILGPEHGPWGTAQDMIPVFGGRDPWTGIEMVSLYEDNESSLRPGVGALAEIDALIIDLQDVGARYYTYAQSAAYAVEAARAAGVEAIVCDRPNPITGDVVEGKVLGSGFESFVGMHPVPQRHGLTLAELVQCYTQGGASIVPMTGWNRRLWYDETGLPWVPPSPNMPTLTSAAVYPGMCLLEGTNLSEGRGTTTPFEVFGAPWIDPFLLTNSMNALGLPGVRFRPHVFQPTFQKHVGEQCGGAQIIVTDRTAIQPLRMAIALLCCIRTHWPTALRWRTEEYEFVSHTPAIDLLMGGTQVREQIDSGVAWQTIVSEWGSHESQWRETRKEWLLYE